MNETAVAPIVPEIVEDYPQLFLTALTEENIDRSEVPAILREFEVSVSLFDIAQQARSIVVTDASQTDLISKAREFRLKLKTERVRISKAKDVVKAPYLRKTQVIDGIHRIIKRMFEAEEAHLQTQEDFAAIKERERIAFVADTRRERLLSYNFKDEVPGLGSLPDANFDLLLAGARAKWDEHIAELKRQEQEDKERLEREAKLLEENERLRLEKEEADHKAESERVERERIETAARQEREVAEQKERDRIAAEEAEKQRVAAAEETERQRLAAETRAKELAPDREKLLAYAQEISKLISDAPRLGNEETNRALTEFRGRLAELQTDLENFAASLGEPRPDCPF
jgi:hypothetical protein